MEIRGIKTKVHLLVKLVEIADSMFEAVIWGRLFY